MNTSNNQKFIKNRREGRVIAFQSIFSYDFNKKDINDILKFDWLTEEHSKESLEYANFLVTGTIQHIEEIDEIIKPKLKNWDINRISSVDRSILRFAIFSLLYEKDLDKKVIINEAIEIAKIFGNDESYKFINGILDAIKSNIIDK